MKGKKVLVVGLGKSGKSAAEVLKKQGADVSIYDKQEYIIGGKGEENILWARENGFHPYFGHFPKDMTEFDQIVMSPGVSIQQKELEHAASNGVEIIGELELAYRQHHGKYIAITGTNGKTTTTVLCGEIFKNAGKDAVVAGNVGVAVSSKAVEASEDTYLITECSSFQLETTRDFRPEVSAILNITPDHLDRHGDIENYGNTKGKIFANQDASQYFVVNADDPESVKQIPRCKATVVPFSRKQELDFGCFVLNGKIVIRSQNRQIIPICSTADLLLPGAHNLENCLAAAAIGYFAGLSPQVIGETLTTFTGVEHRLEFVGEKNGVRFINDSKGTNPDASIKAIESFQNIILIAGGYDKHASFEEYAAAFPGRVDGMIVMGATAEKIRSAAEKVGFTNIYEAQNMKEAVQKAYELAQPGSTVLLSPACASWGMYKCFEDRGDDFKICVKGI